MLFGGKMFLKEYFKEMKLLLGLKSFFSVFSGLIPYIISWSIIGIVNIVSKNEFESTKLIWLVVVFTVTIFLDRIGLTIQMPVDSLLKARSKEFVERKSCEMVRDTDYESIESPEFQEQYSNISRYIDHVSALWDKLLDVLTTLIRFFSLTLLICRIKWSIVLVLFLGGLPVWISYNELAIEKNDFENKIQGKKNIVKYYYEVLTNSFFLKEGKVFGYIDEIKNRWKKLSVVIISLNYKYNMNKMRRELLQRFVQCVAFVLAVILLVRDVFKNSMAVGNAIGLFSTIQQYQNTIRQLSSLVSDFQEIKINYSEMKGFAKKYEFKKENSNVGEQFDIKKSIELQNVYYKYQNAENYALDGVSVKINKGDTIFVVGKNGSGKSTFVKLITGLYKPVKGKILYDGVDRKNIGNIYSNFATLFQNYSKFPFSIKFNITLDNNDNNLDSVMENVGIKDYVKKLPLEEETYLGKLRKNSIDLSEGQWQKIALARVLYRNSDFLIFDEPTSSLDPLAEEQIYKLYSDISHEKTKIIISHRLAFSKYADKILLFQDGRIIEQGNYIELMERKEMFYKMYETQRKLSIGEG